MAALGRASAPPAAWRAPAAPRAVPQLARRGAAPLGESPRGWTPAAGPALGGLVAAASLAAARSRRSRRSARGSRTSAWASRQTVLVAGGGIGGFNLAARLAEMPWEKDGRRSAPSIIMVDPKDRFVFTPLLVDYGISQEVEVDEFAPTYEKLLKRFEAERKTLTAPLEHLKATVVSIDWQRRFAVVRDEGGEERRLEFDALVVSPGQLASPPQGFEVSGSGDNVMPFATLADAEALRARLKEGTPSSVAVVGAGYVGAEVAAAMAELEGCKVTLFGGQLLRGSEPPNQKRTTEFLEELGVDFKEGYVTAVDEQGLSWAPKGAGEQQRFACDLVLTTGNAAAPSAGFDLVPQLDGDGRRLKVDEYMRAAPGIFCVGDAAADAPATGQAAMQQAEIAAWNAYAQCAGLARRAWQKYKPSALGEFVALGRANCAAVVEPAQFGKLLPPALPPAAGRLLAPLVSPGDTDAKLDLGGLPAAVMRRLSYLYRMPTLGHRAWVAKRWAERAKEGAPLPS